MQKYKTVEEFMAALTDDKKSQVSLIRRFILETNPSLTEHIKWNAPSYRLDGEDRLTFSTHNKEDVVKLVFHMGALRKEHKNTQPILDDPFSLIEWASDIRGLISFPTMDKVINSEKAVKQLTASWLAIKFQD
jgi:hypothetical protein